MLAYTYIYGQGMTAIPIYNINNNDAEWWPADGGDAYNILIECVGKTQYIIVYLENKIYMAITTLQYK